MVLVLKNLQDIGFVGDVLNYITVHYSRQHFFLSFFAYVFPSFLQSSASKFSAISFQLLLVLIEFLYSTL